MPDRKARTITSSSPGSGSVSGRISPRPGPRNQNACASTSMVLTLPDLGDLCGSPGGIRHASASSGVIDDPNGVFAIAITLLCAGIVQIALSEATYW